MTLKLKLSEDLKLAMIARDSLKLASVRMIKSEVDRAEQTATGKIELSDGDIMKIIKKLVEGVKETTNLQAEIEIYESYLPKQFTESEMKSIVLEIKDKIGLNSAKDMGKLMTYFKLNYEGQYDGKMLSSIAKEML